MRGSSESRGKKANHWAVSCEPPSIMWGLTSYQQSEQELHLINQSWQLLLGHISSTAFPHPLLQLPLGFTFCWYQLHCCPASVDFLSTGSVIPSVEKITACQMNVDEDRLIYRYDRKSIAGRCVMVGCNVDVHSVCQKGKVQSPLQNLEPLIIFKPISHAGKL